MRPYRNSRMNYIFDMLNVNCDRVNFNSANTFVDDPDSLKRKRHKFNNSSGSIVMQQIQADVDKHIATQNPSIQYSFNLVKPEPMDTTSYDGGNTAAKSSSLYVVEDTFLSSPRQIPQNLRPIHSPEKRTPSPISCMGCQVDIMQQQPQQEELLLEYQLSSGRATPNFQSHDIMYKTEETSLNRMTPEPRKTIEIQQQIDDTDGVNSVLNVDSNQFSFDMNQLGSFNQFNLAELAVLGTTLSENFSSGLSLSESGKTHPAKELGDDMALNIGESSSMTDSFTRLTDTTIQELCTLNSLYKPTKDNDE